MSNIAIFQTGGKQYRVKTGDIVKVEKLNADGTVEFDQVLMLDDKVGTPFVVRASLPRFWNRNAGIKFWCSRKSVARTIVVHTDIASI